MTGPLTFLCMWQLQGYVNGLQKKAGRWNKKMEWESAYENVGTSVKNMAQLCVEICSAEEHGKLHDLK